MIRFLIKQNFAYAEKCFDRKGEIKKPFERYFASFINQVLKGKKEITLRAPNTLTGMRGLIYFSNALDLISNWSSRRKQFCYVDIQNERKRQVNARGKKCNCEVRKMTIYEKIKNMSIKEFAKFIDDISSNCHLNGYYKTHMFCKYCR